MDIRDYAHEGRWWSRIDGGYVAISKDSHYDNNENVVIEAGEGVLIRFEVCPVCTGRGNYVNPAVDAHGITRDEMNDLGEEFFNDYRSGVYNIPCGLCEGLRVIPTPVNKAYTLALKMSANSRRNALAERLAEARMGA
jgi:hypothetical protein